MSTISPTLPSGVTLGQPSATLAVAPLPGPGLSVKAYGAVGDGVTDDSAAIRACFAAAGNTQGVYLPPGSYACNGLVIPNSGINIVGAGRFLTYLVNNSLTASTITFTGSFVTMSGIGFSASVTKTNGFFVAFGTGGQFTLRDFYMQSYYRGIDIEGGITQIQDGVMLNGVPGTPGQFQSGGITIGTTATQPPDAVRICNVIMSNAPGAAMTSYGIQCFSTGDTIITDCNIIGQGVDLSVTPSTGQAVGSIWALNTFFDTAQVGIFMQAYGTGSISRCRFSSCWTGSHTNNGVTINGTSAGIYSIHFDNHQSCNNTQAGFAVVGSGPSDISIIGGLFAGNGSHGIYMGVAAKDFTVMGVSSGAYGGFGGNTGSGVYVDAGAGDRYVIQGCRVHGNSVAGVSDNGTGSNKSVTGNVS